MIDDNDTTIDAIAEKVKDRLNAEARQREQARYDAPSLWDDYWAMPPGATTRRERVCIRLVQCALFPAMCLGIIFGHQG